MMTFGKAFKEYRLNTKRWTLQQMANTVGVTAQSVWKIENEKVTPHELTVAKIKHALPEFAERLKEALTA